MHTGAGGSIPVHTGGLLTRQILAAAPCAPVLPLSQRENPY